MVGDVSSIIIYQENEGHGGSATSCDNPMIEGHDGAGSHDEAALLLTPTLSPTSFTVSIKLQGAYAGCDESKISSTDDSVPVMVEPLELSGECRTDVAQSHPFTLCVGGVQDDGGAGVGALVPVAARRPRLTWPPGKVRRECHSAPPR